MDAKSLKYFLLDQIDHLIAKAPEGPKVIREKEPIDKFYHRFDGRLTEKTTHTTVDQKFHTGPDVYQFIEFNICTTRIKVRNEANILRHIRKQVSAMPFRCFEIKDF